MISAFQFGGSVSRSWFRFAPLFLPSILPLFQERSQCPDPSSFHPRPQA